MKIEGKNRGGEGTTPVTTAFVQKLESESVRKKKAYHLTYVSNVTVLTGRYVT